MLVVRLGDEMQGVDSDSMTAIMCIKLGLVTAAAVQRQSQVVVVNLEQAVGRRVKFQLTLEGEPDLATLQLDESDTADSQLL